MTKVVKKRSKVGVVTSILKKNQLKQRVRRGGDGVIYAKKKLETLKALVKKIQSTIDLKTASLEEIADKKEQDVGNNEIIYLNKTLEEAKSNVVESENNLQNILDSKLVNISSDSIGDGPSILESGSPSIIDGEPDSIIANHHIDKEPEKTDASILQGAVEAEKNDYNGCFEKFKQKYDSIFKESYAYYEKQELDIIFTDYFKNNNYENKLSEIKKSTYNDKVYDLIIEVIAISNYINNEDLKKDINNVIIDTGDYSNNLKKNEINDCEGINNRSLVEKPKLDKNTINNIMIDSLNLLNIHNMLRINTIAKIYKEDYIRLLEMQFKFYFVKCIMNRIIYYKFSEDKHHNIYIRFNDYTTNVRGKRSTQWIIDIIKSDRIKLWCDNNKVILSSAQPASGGGNKSLSVNKIKEIADKLKVSHLKCKNKESIMTKIKSIDLQKLTIEQLKIYCKLFNIRGCSKCKSKKSLLLHTKSNMKLR